METLKFLAKFAQLSTLIVCSLPHNGSAFFGGNGIDPDMLSELLEILPDLIECAGYSRGLFYIPLRKEKRTS
ncbi:hypothetical protein FNH47_12555 [Salmonella enterica subsp. houtenae]|uniref:Uncharacterized protein n=1 Tax=Salmonella houtenae TaxID=59205 RepID=A0A5Y2SGJ7_SALHO|nr:hypothetical protein [Salmonella enterica subsp. houtenae]QKT20652.1 hypothetical protein HPG84_23410 [Salmonella enterica]HCL4436065.1 hypothetical protein [Salmonella enterica]HCL5083779.1 hypothetical protein [Salmonella enterica]